MVTAVITSKGQVVIPSFIRKRLGLKKGVRLCISEKGDKIILQPLTDDYFEKMAGILPSKGKLSKALIASRKEDAKKENKR